MKQKLLSLDDFEVKFDAGEDEYRFAGYASVFNGVDSYGDMIAPGAYRKTLKGRERPVQLRWNHYGPVIGKWITLKEDDRGLYVEGELTRGHSMAEDAWALLKHGAVSGLSIGYRVMKWEQKDDHVLLKEIELIEISVVEEPADNAARVSEMKALIDAAGSWKEIEAILRDEGRFSRDAATKLVARCKALAHGERAESETSRAALETVQSLITRLKRR